MPRFQKADPRIPPPIGYLRLRHRQPQAQRADVHIEPAALHQRGYRQRRLGRLRRRQLTQIDAQPLRILVVDLDIVALGAKQQRIAPFPVMVDIHIDLLPAGRHVIIEVKTREIGIARFAGQQRRIERHRPGRIRQQE